MKPEIIPQPNLAVDKLCLFRSVLAVSAFENLIASGSYDKTIKYVISTIWECQYQKWHVEHVIFCQYQNVFGHYGARTIE